MKSCGVKSCELCKEQIKICAIVDEQIKNICRSPSKVDQNIAFVFRLRKLLGNIAFANTTRSVNHHGRRTFAAVFPGNERIIDFSFQHSITSFEDSISII